LAKAAATIGLAKDAYESGGLSKSGYGKVVNEQIPDPAKEREQADADVDRVEKDKQQDRIDESQQKEMTEDRRRKSHGTVKPTPSAPRKGKRKYRMTLILKDIEER